MSTHKSETIHADLCRKWPHHVALPADKARGFMNSGIVHNNAAALSSAPVTYSLRRDDIDCVVFCFAKPEDAEAFSERFGGERLSVTAALPRLSAERRVALQLLAGDPRGTTGHLLMIAFGLEMKLLAGLVHEGLAEAKVGELVEVGGKLVEVVHFWITDAGRIALAAS
jgi:hypothetical protein